jgi:uncharacterized damage-inducible protein DinB
MSLKDNFHLLARYNQWMNHKVYQLAAELSDETLRQHRGAFFGSVAGTLNHILVADLIWLNRFQQLFPDALPQLKHYPKPTALNQQLYTDFQQQWQSRTSLDQLLTDFCAGLDEAALQQVLIYNNMKGEAMHKKFAAVLQHLFNHQTHHRGQLTTLFSQLGLDIGVTDLLMLIDNE